MSRPFRPRVLALAAACLGLWLGACETSPTSAFVEVRFDPALELTQFTFVLVTAEDTALPQLTRPEEPGGPLTSPQTIRLLLPEGLHGTEVALTVVGLRDGEERARDMRTFTPSAGEEVESAFDLSAPADDRCGGLNPCAPGLRCENGLCVCDVESCPAGCCDESGCRTRTASTCGAAGATCFACDERSDGCGADGSCACGSGPACVQGQRCVGGGCVCDGQSCNGCCEGNTCRGGNDLGACGVNGAACQPCELGDTCSDGICSGCNPSTCGGCCTGSRCLDPSFGACGASGVACGSCDPLKADNCSEVGTCRCGEGMPCGNGRQCVMGACTCTPESCAGCCAGNTCMAGTAVGQCGSDGNACRACPGGNKCVNGECRCGSGRACGLCVAGICLG